MKINPNSKHLEWANETIAAFSKDPRNNFEIIAERLAEFEAEVTGWKPIEKGMASAQPCETNDSLNAMRLECFRSNLEVDRNAYFSALNLAFQQGDLIAYDLVAQPEKEGE